MLSKFPAKVAAPHIVYAFGFPRGAWALAVIPQLQGFFSVSVLTKIRDPPGHLGAHLVTFFLAAALS